MYGLLLFQKQFKCSHYGMHITDAWAMGYKGENIVVGIVDTGIEATHSDLAANMVIHT